MYVKLDDAGAGARGRDVDDAGGVGCDGRFRDAWEFEFAGMFGVVGGVFVGFAGDGGERGESGECEFECVAIGIFGCGGDFGCRMEPGGAEFGVERFDDVYGDGSGIAVSGGAFGDELGGVPAGLPADGVEYARWRGADAAVRLQFGLHVEHFHFR